MQRWIVDRDAGVHVLQQMAKKTRTKRITESASLTITCRPACHRERPDHMRVSGSPSSGARTSHGTETEATFTLPPNLVVEVCPIVLTYNAPKLAL